MRRSCLVSWLALCLAGALFAVPAAFAAPPDPFAGVWIGKGATEGYQDNFDIKITIFPDGSATLAYEGVSAARTYHCAGLLLPIARDGHARTFREKIDQGECIDAATVRLTRRGGGLVWSWSGESAGKPVTAKGALAPGR